MQTLQTKHYSPHKRTRIAVGAQNGKSKYQIAAEEGCSPGSVHGITKRYRVQQSAVALPRSGRPKILTEYDKRHILRLINQNPFISNTDIKTQAGLTCHVDTITRWLKLEGVQHMKALRRPKLNPNLAQKRLEFARRFIMKPDNFWKLWSFSDEVTVARGDGEQQKWVFCRRGERLLPKNVQGKAKPTRHSQMSWGGFSFFRKSALVPLYGHPDSPRGGVNAQRILETLQAQLPEICDPGSIFMQDNARTHTATIVQDWLIPWAEKEGVELIDWPAYSPDLNPIENFWKLLKEEICKRYPELSDMPKNNTSLELLRKAAAEVWNDFPDELLQELAKSMRRRLAAVIAADGWYTKY